MKILIIDNYDSFTFNLYQLVGEVINEKIAGSTIDVVRNDKLTLAEIKNRNYDRIIISPGPGDPRDQKYFGVCAVVIQELGETTPLFGVCLGMQGIAYSFGGNIIHANQPMHGKTSIISHNGRSIFKDVPQHIEVMRYHSLIVEEKSLPNCLLVTATVVDPSGQTEIMGLRHKTLPIEGVQFHPESFATEGGKKMVENFLLQNI